MTRFAVLLIHARLKATAARFPAILDSLAALPMYARYQVGDCRVGIVHGDADSLAGWQFDASEMDRTENQSWLAKTFDQAQVDVFASTHTCEPALRRIDGKQEGAAVVNNGAAGMPNFRGDLQGLITRVATTPSPHRPCYGTRIRGAYVDALSVGYDQSAWQTAFLRNWPEGSDAYQSYFDRISNGTAVELTDAFSEAKL